MLTIGIVGDENEHTLSILRNLQEECNCEKESIVFIPLGRGCGLEQMDFDVLMIIKNNESITEFLRANPISAPVTILNADEKGMIAHLRNRNTKLITFGFNPRACVTASSVTESGLVFCIQRAFSGLCGKEYCEQEFFVPLSNCEQYLYCVLAAITGALVCNMDVLSHYAVL